MKNGVRIRRRSRRTGTTSGLLRRSQVAQEFVKLLRRKSEPKFYDSTISATVGNTYGVYALSQPIVQGIGGGQRVGDNISYLDLTMIYRVDINLNTTIVNNIRIIVFLDKMNDGVVPVVSDLLVNATITSTYSPQQIKEKRFTILHDAIHNVAIGGITSISERRKITLNQVCSYLAATNVNGANGKNSMWAFLIGTDGTNMSSFNMDFQIRFIDP